MTIAGFDVSKCVPIGLFLRTKTSLEIFPRAEYALKEGVSPPPKSQAFPLTFPDRALLLCVCSYDRVRQGDGGGHQDGGRRSLTFHQAAGKVAMITGTIETQLVVILGHHVLPLLLGWS